MITVYAPDALDWSNNGLCQLFPTSCPIKEVAAGIYEMELNHPISDDQRWTHLQKGYLIKAPVPKRDTPLISIWHDGNEGQPGHVIYKVQPATGSKASLRTRGTTSAPVIEWLKPGTEIIYHGTGGMTNWSIVTAPSGNTGKIYNNNIVYVRTEPEIPATPSYNTVVPARQVREQLFRIYDMQIDTKQHTVKVLARHISYAQLGNFVKSYNPKDVPLQVALNAMSADMINAHDFSYYTNITKEITAEWALKNGASVLLDPDEGAAPKTGAQVVRDNYDVFLLEDTETDRGVVIASGKNLLGVVCKINDDNAVTRIMPYGTDKDGKVLLLPEVYIDSPYIGNYPTIRAIPLQVQEAMEKAASGDDPGMTKEQAYEKMRQAVQEKYNAGCDLPDIDIQVDFVQLGDTEEYKAYKNLQQLYLYDTVTVKHGRLGLLYKAKVTGYTYDAALKRYTSMSVGSVKSGADLGVIAGFQLPNAGVSGMKLVPGSVGSQQLRQLSVLSAHIGLAQIVNAHIQDATIDKAKIKDFVAEVATIAVAKIGDAWIDQAWINQLSAKVVDIVTANIDTLIVNNATIQWAQIANLTAAVTDIVLAKIQTANINWAHITGLVAETAMFTQGASGKLYCADLMVTDANVESLSANKIAGGMATFGKLMLMGQDGKLYEINVGTLGEVTAQEKQLDGDNVGDYVLTDRNMANGTLTARTLNVQSIFSDSALIRQLIAQSIDTDTLFANLGYINALRTHLIQSDIGQFLNLESNTGIQLMVSDALAPVQATADSALSSANAAQSTANSASSAAAAAATAASNAQTTANSAQSAANTANSKLTDIASDSKLTPAEKQAAKKEWDIIVSEKVKIDAQADVYGVSKTAYGTAYIGLNTYVTPLLSDLNATNDITGNTFRSTFKAYYDARQDILNAISTAAKNLADAAQGTANSASAAAAAAATAAGNAQTAANNAQTSADTANNKLTDIASDSKLTPAEKQATKKEWDIIVSEKVKIDSQADVFSVSKTAYGTAYNNLNTYITPLLSNLNATSDITGTTFRSTFKVYYDARQDILNAISTAAKTLADGKYSKITGLNITSGLVEILALVTRILGGQFYVSDNSNPDAATFFVDNLEKIVKAVTIQTNGLLLNGNVTGNNNVFTKTSMSTLNIYAGDDIQAIIDALPKYLVNDLTINIEGNAVYEGFRAKGFTGGCIYFVLGAGIVFTSGIEFIGCSQYSIIGNSSSYAQINAGSGAHCIYCIGGYCRGLRYLRCTGKPRTSDTDGTNYGIRTYGALLWIRDNIIERTIWHAVYSEASVAIVQDCIGGYSGGNYTTVANLGRGISAYYGASVSVGGNGVLGEVASLATYRAPSISGTNTPTASPGAPSTPTIYEKNYVYDSNKYCDLPTTASMATSSSVWSTGYPRGGIWNTQNLRYSGMWLLKLDGGNVQNILTGLSGKTIKTANLTVYCDTCWAGSAEHDLYYMRSSSLPVGGDAPANKLTDTGINITLTQGESTVVNLKTWLQNMVNAGTAFYGFGLGLAGSYVKMTALCDFDITYED